MAAQERQAESCLEELYLLASLCGWPPGGQQEGAGWPWAGTGGHKGPRQGLAWKMFLHPNTPCDGQKVPPPL